ncbi:GGDEF domain-containing protein [Acidisoma sp. C75]
MNAFAVLPEPITLVSVLSLVVVLAGLNYLIIWLQNRPEVGLLWLMVAAFSAAAGLFLRGVLPESYAIALGPLGLMLGYALLWCGSRRLAGKPPAWPALGAIAVLWLLVTRLPVFLQHSGWRVVLGYALTALLLLLTLREVLGLPERRRAGYWSTVALLGLFGSFCLGWSLFQIWQSLGAAPDGPSPTHFNVLLFAFVTPGFHLVISYALVALVKERSELAHARAAERDGLTGLGNRQRLSRTTARAMVEARRAGHRIGIIMIDIDHFKAFNDRYGHPVGDTCLSMVASCLAHCILRPQDEVMRYGGEEFIVLLREAEEEAALALAERMRLAVRGLALPHAASPEGIVTISLGSAVLPAASTTIGEIITAADRALYRAKQTGRDRSVLARSEEMPWRGEPLGLSRVLHED